MSEGAVRSVIRQYVLDELTPGQDPEELSDDTPLMSGGILDSIATVKLVDLLEKRFGVTFQARDLSVQRMDTVASITELVEAKLRAR